MITYINMKKIIIYFTAIIIAIAYTSCRDCEYEVDYSAAALWKNGVKQELPYGDLSGYLDVRTYSIFVSGGDVYVAGADRGSAALLWKNGIAQILPQGTRAYSVFVYDNDVYVVGNIYVWKNGEIVDTLNGGAYSVFVYEGDVYVAGKSVWKNGEVIQTLGSEANSIVVYNGDVYVATEYTVYKNGEVIQSANKGEHFYSLFILDGDVYIGGNGKVWKNGNVEKLIEKFWPGPLTLVLPKKEIVPELVTSGNPTVAVRMPNHPVALELIRKSGTPIAAPSANRFGQLSPTDAQHVVKQLKNRVDVILNGGHCEVGVESTILEIQDNKIFLLRPGGLALEDIEAVVGKVEIKPHNTVNPNSPGQLAFHYSPVIPLKFYTEENIAANKGKRIAVIYFREKKTGYGFAAEKVLSPAGDLREAAANLFSYLHEFEKETIDVILIEPVEETGLGRAIMDRLRKATNKYR